jgi:hypothetical protein
VGGVSCQSKTSAQYTTATPEGTVRLLLDAYCELNAGKVAEFWVKEERKEVRFQMGELFKQFESVTISDIEIEVLSQTENTAKVNVQYFLNATVKESIPQSYYPPKEVSYELDLIKQDGKWLIKTPVVGK